MRATATKIDTASKIDDATKIGKTKPNPKPNPKPQLFHARMLVTRVEEWCVDAHSAAEARTLFESGAGHKCAPGESVSAELEQLLED